MEILSKSTLTLLQDESVQDAVRQVLERTAPDKDEVTVKTPTSSTSSRSSNEEGQFRLVKVRRLSK